MIKLIVNDVELDLKSETIVALTKKTADIGNLQNRWSSYTNKFSVPKTKKNRNALGIKQFQDASGTQYEYQNGKLISGGLEIATNVLVVIEEVSEEIVLTLRAGNGNLFTKLTKVKLRDLYWDDLDHFWNQSEIYARRNKTWVDGLIYPIFQSGAQSKATNWVVMNGLIPFIFVMQVFKRIEDYFDYKFDGIIQSTSAFQNLVFPISSLQIDPSFANQYLFQSNLPYKNFNYATELYLKVQTPLVLNIVNDPKSRARDINVKYGNNTIKPARGYGIPFKAKYYFNFTYSLSYRRDQSNSFSGIVKLRLIVYDTKDKINSLFVHTQDLPFAPNTTGTFTGNFNVEHSFTNEITDANRYVYYVMVYHENVEVLTINSGTFNITKVEATETSFLSEFQIKNCIPDVTISDFIKDVANIFGIIYDVDEFNRKIEMVTLKDISDNKKYAYDWSEKLDESKSELTTFKYDGIGKITKWRWKDDLLFSKNLIVNNDQLNETSEYIKVDSPYSEDQFALTQPNPMYAMDAFKNGKIELDGELRFAFLRTRVFPEPNVVFTNVSGQNYQVSDWRAAYFHYTNSPSSLDWNELYEEYYEGILKPMTEKLQIVECDFKLNDLDVQSFRFKYPVYIQKFGRYFFVNEISEYTDKAQSTKAILIGI